MARIPTLEEALQAPANPALEQEQRAAMRGGWQTVTAEQAAAMQAEAERKLAQGQAMVQQADPLGQYTEQERSWITYYAVTMLGKVSPHTNELCVDAHSILRHAKADQAFIEQQAQARRVATIEQFGTPDERRQLAEQQRLDKDARSAKNKADHAARYEARQLHAGAVENARQAWKTAVQQRREYMLKWDDYVRQLHNEYTRIKLDAPKF